MRQPALSWRNIFHSDASRGEFEQRTMQRMMLPATCQYALPAFDERITDSDGKGGCATGGEQDLLAPADAKEVRNRLVSFIERPRPL